MALLQGRSSRDIDYTLEHRMYSQTSQQALTERVESDVEEADIVPGRILWLPSREVLPDRAVRRVRGKGAIEEGIYSHPVVVLSRPADESHTVHFHLITSLQGKTLDQLYFKATEFHTSRRSWYLPIAPTPDHPDANSKKTKKRFPTLDLAHAVTLRWDSYVNIRHVYKIDWQLLKVYTNPNTPHVESVRFERESMIRLLAKSKILTMYVPGPQHQVTGETDRCATNPAYMPAANVRVAEQRPRDDEMRVSEQLSVISVTRSVSSSPTQSDFRMAGAFDTRIAGPHPKVPPDASARPTTTDPIPAALKTLDRLWGQIVSGLDGAMLPKSVNTKAVADQLDQAWMYVRGGTAVIIASV